jgi:hypothetical protein
MSRAASLHGDKAAEDHTADSSEQRGCVKFKNDQGGPSAKGDAEHSTDSAP